VWVNSTTPAALYVYAIEPTRATRARYSSRHEIQRLCRAVAPLKVSRWHEHLPVASLALSALLERAARGGAQFTAAERALFTACECWAAVETRTLIAHLGPHDADALRYLSIVYSAMGAHHVARNLITAVAEMGDTATPLGRLQCLTALQQRLARTKDPVDQLIADLAHDLGLSAMPHRNRVEGSGAELSAQLAWAGAGTDRHALVGAT
jgi:hypothetical protein